MKTVVKRKPGRPPGKGPPSKALLVRFPLPLGVRLESLCNARGLSYAEALRRAADCYLTREGYPPRPKGETKR